MVGAVRYLDEMWGDPTPEAYLDALQAIWGKRDRTHSRAVLKAQLDRGGGITSVELAADLGHQRHVVANGHYGRLAREFAREMGFEKGNTDWFVAISSTGDRDPTTGHFVWQIRKAFVEALGRFEDTRNLAEGFVPSRERDTLGPLRDAVEAATDEAELDRLRIRIDAIEHPGAPRLAHRAWRRAAAYRAAVTRGRRQAAAVIEDDAEAIAAVERLLRDKMLQDRRRQDGVSTVRNLRALDVGEESDIAATAREMVVAQGGRCALCDATLGAPRNDNSLWAWSIDRIESEGRAGHLKGNVQLTHLGCNRLKGADSNSEARAFLEGLRSEGPIMR